MLKIKNTEIPDKAGIYIFKNIDGEPLYVGKAKNLRKRVPSYFNLNTSWKTKRLVNEAEEISFVVSQTEGDALLAEYSFIQEYKPKYNIQFKDDKSYPYISIVGKEWKRAVVTRSLKSSNINFGPFPFVGAARRSLDHLINIYPIRTCNETVFKRHIKLKKPCLLYDINKCSGPCIGKVTEAEYQDQVNEIQKFYEGYSDEIINDKTNLMKDLSNKRAYEEANKIKDSIQHLESARATQVLMTTEKKSADVIAIDIGTYDVLASCFFIRNGRIVGEKKIIYEPLNPKVINEYLGSLIIDLIIKNKPSGTIVLSHELESKQLLEKLITEKTGIKTSIENPKRGWKRDLLDNAIEDSLEMRRVANLKRRSDLEFRSLSLEQIKNNLNLPKIPYRIEGYDISNIGSENRVGSMVVMEDGLPKKSMYRRFHIKTFKGQDDYKSLEEILYRRFNKQSTNPDTMDVSFSKTPDLIVIDGGKGQLSSATKVLQYFKLEIPIIALAKKNEEIYKPNVKESIKLPEDSEAMFILKTIRDEAHRFAINENRRLRLKKMRKNDLLSIEGIGEKTLETLLNKYGTLSKISRLSYDELTTMIKPSIAKRVFEYFNE